MNADPRSRIMVNPGHVHLSTQSNCILQGRPIEETGVEISVGNHDAEVTPRKNGFFFGILKLFQ